MVEDRAGLGLTTLQRQTDELVRRLQKQPTLVGVSTQFRSTTPQLFMDIDRTKVASLGIPLDDVNQTLQIYLGSLYVNNFNAFGRHWQVNVQADGDFRDRVDDINLLQVRNNQGEMVPLGALGNVREIGGPIFVNRYNLYTAASISGGLRPGVSTGDVIDAVDKLANEYPVAFHEQGVDRADVHADPGRVIRRCTSSRWRSPASFWPWRRCTRAGRCRWP